MSMCSYCGAARGEYCGISPSAKVYRGGECGAARKAREQAQTKPTEAKSA